MDLAERKGDSKTKEMIIYSVTLKKPRSLRITIRTVT